MAEGKASSARRSSGGGALGEDVDSATGSPLTARPGGPRQLNANEPSPLPPFVDALVLLLLCFSGCRRVGWGRWGSHTDPPSRKQGSRALLWPAWAFDWDRRDHRGPNRTSRAPVQAAGHATADRPLPSRPRRKALITSRSQPLQFRSELVPHKATPASLSAGPVYLGGSC